MLKTALTCKIDSEHFWTDSIIVLGNINSDAKRFHVYVANRIQQIKDHTSVSQWKHVKTEITLPIMQGMNIDALKGSNLYNGPSFLWDMHIKEDELHTNLKEDDPEVRAQVMITSAKEDTSSCLTIGAKFSTLKRAVRFAELCLKNRTANLQLWLKILNRLNVLYSTVYSDT